MYAEDYQTALIKIHSRPKMHKEGSLKRMQRAVAAFDHPEKKLTAIHVAGTNGKGSVVNDLRYLANEQGMTVGTFTSPFLMRFNERISIDGEPISDADLLDLVNQVGPQVATLDAAAPDDQITEFEFVTLLMLVYFVQQPLDLVIIEVGIGGLTDATNVITPLVSVITTIGYDHMALLGDTLAEITTHKAGIIKSGQPVVVGRLPAEALAVVTDTAQRNQSQLYRLGADFKTTRQQALASWGETFDFTGLQQQIKGVELPMLGDYQVDNAAVAIATFILALQQLQQTTDAKTIKQGLAQAKWLGRLEKLNEQPLIVLDGAHNEPAMQALASTLQANFSHLEIYIIFAALQDKATAQMLAILERLPNVHLILTQFTGNSRVASVDELEQASEQELPIYTHWQMALQAVLQEASADDMLLLTGSLYFVSEVRHYFES
ncbi:bifunctional folylpolyglutamate synthase/dihydrofolate synthase [Loigolactobacillus zhaoyuanensis]|uniref:bifunctional folylpolyglutamate synthase/dihydrofolate synthase n=1 Tax=Loigolactobacillus zhaoyuanensis TaxID=2486017 RepID=UPI000F7393E0|nr:folylpolyglutamate synthase/dihydrofolate synthase family protein [Loigolactobacillus zhaoyuanensis]